MPTYDHEPQRIVVAGVPAYSAADTPTSSNVFAAAYIPCPQDPIMAKEENVTTARRLKAPSTLCLIHVTLNVFGANMVRALPAVIHAKPASASNQLAWIKPS